MFSQVGSFRVLCGAFFGRLTPSAAFSIFSEGVGADAVEGTCKYILKGWWKVGFQPDSNISYLWAVLGSDTIIMIVATCQLGTNLDKLI